MHRLFAGTLLPEPIRDLLIDAMDEGPEFRWQSEDQLHLTLRFIGEVERPLAEDIAMSLARVRSPRIALRIAGTGRFDQTNSGALWAGVEPREPVAALAAKIERVCQSTGLPPERRAFYPHITLARWRGRRSREAAEFIQRSASLASDPFDIEDFVLFESRLSRHGAHYEAVSRYPLS